MDTGSIRLFIAALLFLIDAAVTHAGRPLTIDDVKPVGTGQLEIELGVYHGLPNRGGRDQKWPVAAVTYGVFEQLEVGLAIQRINQDGPGTAPTRGVEDLHFNAKYKFLNETTGFPLSPPPWMSNCRRPAVPKACPLATPMKRCF